MKRVDRYQANDGAIFLSEDEAVKRDELLAAIAQAMAPLGTRNDDKLQRGWVHHAPLNVSNAKRALLKLARPVFEKSFPEITRAIDTDPDSVHPSSMVGRVLDDYDGPLKDAWYRFRCIDKEGREHNQPYFSMHDPNPGHVCVEDRR